MNVTVAAILAESDVTAFAATKPDVLFRHIYNNIIIPRDAAAPRDSEDLEQATRTWFYYSGQNAGLDMVDASVFLLGASLDRSPPPTITLAIIETPSEAHLTAATDPDLTWPLMYRHIAGQIAQADAPTDVTTLVTELASKYDYAAAVKAWFRYAGTTSWLRHGVPTGTRQRFHFLTNVPVLTE